MSTNSPLAAPDAGPLSPGAQLRAARERRGHSINEAAFALKLSQRQIVALETDDFDALPGMALVRGFMRNYARYLGLDPQPLLDAVQELAGRGAVDLSPIRNADGDLPSGAARRRSTRWSGWAAATLVVVVLAGWYFDWFETQPRDGAHVAEAVAPASGDTPSSGAEARPEATAETSAPAPAATTDAALPPASAAATVPAAAAEAGKEGAAAAAAPAASAAEPAASAASSEAVPAPAVAGGSQLSFRFGGESWVEVRDSGGTIIHSGVNRADTARTVHGKPPFTLVIGNAAQVKLELDGKPVDLVPHTKVSVARLTLQ